MRITELKVDNFKRIKIAHVKLEDGLILVTGENANGKTSFLDAIEALLNGGASIPAQAVRNGSDKSTIVGTLEGGDDVLVCKRTIKADNTTTLTVQNKDGMKLQGPQAVLDRLLGKLTFDPLGFTRMDPKKRLETLKSLVGLDFTALNNERQAAFDSRSDVNKEIKSIAARIAAAPKHEGVPAKEESVADLSKEHQRLFGLNNENATARTALKDAEKSLVDQKSARLGIANQIIELQKQLAEHDEGIEFAEANLAGQRGAVAQLKDHDLTEIQTRMGTVEATNRKVRDNATRAKLDEELRLKNEQAAQFTARIDLADRKKEDLMSKAEFPIEGLSFGEDGVIFNDVPFEQASSAEQLKVSIAIAIALNPGIRVILIRDGSLLDQSSMRIVEEMAKKYEMQILLEKVADGDGRTGIIFENGEVVGQEVGASA